MCDTHMCVYKYYSALKKEEILPLATTWMNLEGITPREVSQTEEDKYRVTFLPCESEQNKTPTPQTTEDRLVVGRGRGEGCKLPFIK